MDLSVENVSRGVNDGRALEKNGCHVYGVAGMDVG